MSKDWWAVQLWHGGRLKIDFLRRSLGGVEARVSNRASTVVVDVTAGASRSHRKLSGAYFVPLLVRGGRLSTIIHAALTNTLALDRASRKRMVGLTASTATAEMCVTDAAGVP